MKLANIVTVGLLVVGVSLAVPAPEAKERRAIDPVTAGLVIKAAVPFIKEVVAPIAKKLAGIIFGDTNWDDEILAGRSVRITGVGNTGATAKDKDTGIAITVADGQFPNKEQSVATACSELIQKMMRLGIVSVHDLGIPVPITTTKAPCENKMGSRYCDRQKKYGMCDKQAYKDYMQENCNKSCFCADTVTMTKEQLQALIAKLTG
ncbi:uncharacterized protein LOC141900873 [Tubulanus polymorphus]|uniref:uncharacterized protein LOC141900873 n=1 Tax=Tubulanus polymorphus TaxID=672921 RepID=UPI003DA2A8A3